MSYRYLDQGKMYRAVLLLSVVGISFCQLGGWQPLQGPLPAAVVTAAKITLIGLNKNYDVHSMTTSNNESQVVAGTNYRFDITLDVHGSPQPATCSMTVYYNLQQVATVSSHTC